jgi:hypothetical protein
MAPRLKTAGLRAIEIAAAYAGRSLIAGAFPDTGRLLSHVAGGRGAGACHRRREAPDVVLIDAMFPTALAQAGHFDCPSIVFVHTFVFHQLDMGRKMIGTLDGMRRQAGFPGLPTLDEQWRRRERIISTSLAAFDAAPQPGWEMMRHAGRHWRPRRSRCRRPCRGPRTIRPR